MPPGDDDYVPGGGQRGRRPETRAEPPRINLTPFWTKDTRSWFTLTESTFNRYGVHDSRLMFDLVLPALPDEALEQVRAILHSVSETPDPYNTLKERLVEIYTPSDLDMGFRLLHSPELGDRRPSAMMEAMLAMLPPGEQEGILFRCIFISRLPSDIADLVTAKAKKKLTARQLASYADDLWLARHVRGGQPVMAAVDKGSDGEEEVTETIAALKVRQPKKFFKKGQGRQQADGQQQYEGQRGPGQKKKAGWVCWRHATFKDRAYNCDNPGKCTYAGNE